MKNYLRFFAAAFVLVFSFATAGVAQTAPSKNFPNIKIRNFGQMDEGYYRGAQPKKEDYKALKELGVQTIIDLRDDAKSWAKPTAESLGMKYINIPMGDGDYPAPEHIEQFLKVVNDPSTGVFFAHCRGGKHRTGVTGAVYRFNKYGWDYETAFKEMKNYKFYSMFGYGDMKEFVQDYYRDWQAQKAGPTVAASAAKAAAADASQGSNK